MPSARPYVCRVNVHVHLRLVVSKSFRAAARLRIISNEGKIKMTTSFPRPLDFLYNNSVENLYYSGRLSFIIEKSQTNDDDVAYGRHSHNNRSNGR